MRQVTLRPSRGELNGNAKLTIDAVRHIRAEAARLPTSASLAAFDQDMAARFAVGPHLVARVRRGAVWTHVR